MRVTLNLMSGVLREAEKDGVTETRREEGPVKAVQRLEQCTLKPREAKDYAKENGRERFSLRPSRANPADTSFGASAL